MGSTRNSILQGTFELNFQEIVTGHVDEVWALSTHPSQNQFLTAGYDNLLHLWDTLTHRAVWSSNIGVSSIKNAFHRIEINQKYQIGVKLLLCLYLLCIEQNVSFDLYSRTYPYIATPYSPMR